MQFSASSTPAAPFRHKMWGIWAIAGWLLLNLLQAAFTELGHDEAYYGVYAENLAIGYFDHPPAVALLIRMGMALLPGEIGLRLFVVLAGTLTLYLLWRLAGDEDPRLFFTLYFSVLLAHIAGFFAAPDIPMLLSTAFFLFCLRQYLAEENAKTILLLAVAAALVPWSKYHGLMVIFFALLSRPRLLGRRSFWIVAFVAAALFLPHLIWMAQNGFSSLVYHLGDRSKLPYTFKNTSEYLTGLWAGMGPFSSLLVLAAAFRYKVGDPFERALKFILWGVLLFLLLMSFDGRVEVNWAAAALAPMLVLAYRFLLNRPAWQRWFYRLALPGIALALALRLFLAWNYLPALQAIRPEFHGWPRWAQQLDSIAAGAPVVALNSYQYASKYNFYGANPAWSLNTLYYRKNQFDLLGLEEQLQGKRVLVFSRGLKPGMDSLYSGAAGNYSYLFVDNLRTWQKLRIALPEATLRFRRGDTLRFPLRLVNPYPYPVDFSLNPELPVKLCFAVYERGRRVKEGEIQVSDIGNLRFEKDSTLEGRLRLDLAPGPYELFTGLKYGWLGPGRQGGFKKIVIE